MSPYKRARYSMSQALSIVLTWTRKLRSMKFFREVGILARGAALTITFAGPVETFTLGGFLYAATNRPTSRCKAGSGIHGVLVGLE